MRRCASCTTLPHFAISLLMRAPNSSGLFATGTKPTVDSVRPAAGGGRVDFAVVNRGGRRVIDVVYTAPPGAALDVASILDSLAEFDVVGAALTECTAQDRTEAAALIPVVRALHRSLSRAETR